MTGFYLALEGGEGAGKTTVVQLLEEALADRGEQVVTVREPGSTELGDEIRRLVLHWRDMTPWAEAMLFAAQRAQLVAEVVRPALEAGRFVITDRSIYSSLAYQGGARRLGYDLVREVNEIALGGVLPDLVTVLMVDLSTGLSPRHMARLSQRNNRHPFTAASRGCSCSGRRSSDRGPARRRCLRRACA